MIKMATKSFLKNVVIKDRKTAEKFVNALVKAENKRSKEIKVNKITENITEAEQIRKIFD